MTASCAGTRSSCSSGMRKVMEELKLDKALADHIDEHIKDCEEGWTMMRKASSPPTFSYISGVVDKAVKKKRPVWSTDCF